MSAASGLLGGVFYPVNVLPSWLEPLSDLLPITHALEAMRQILLNGATLGAVSNQAAILTLFAAILLPIGLGAFASQVCPFRRRVYGTGKDPQAFPGILKSGT